MGWRDHLHLGLADALGLHHADPLIQQLSGLRRLGGMVYDLQEEMDQHPLEAGSGTWARANAYYGAAQVLVTFADAFILDAFLDPEHPKHVPHVTFLQAAQFYHRVPELVTAIRRELAYSGSGDLRLPILPGARIEAEGKCPLEHLLAMQRAADQTEQLLGTRIELMERQGGHSASLKTAVLMMTNARTHKSAADLVLGALKRGERVPAETHEAAEASYYDGVLRTYLYAAQELALPGVTAAAPDSEDEAEPVSEPRRRVVNFPSVAGGLNSGLSLGSGGMNWGTLITADIVANMVGDLLGGLLGGGNNWF